MPFVDADTHVDECEETWEHLEEADRQFRPVTVIQQGTPDPRTPRGYHRFWLIDGQFRVRRVRDDERTGTVQATRELQDVELRLHHMDNLGVGIQVLYPTLFLTQVSGKPEVERALCRAYNRWLADRCAQGGGRLRWVALAPLLGMDDALEELRFAKEHGACGVMKKGRECGNRAAGDPYFYPLYQEANRLDLPICFHLGSGDASLSDTGSRTETGMITGILPVLDAFYSLATAEVPKRFPNLRVGFIETTASWVPYLLTELLRRQKRMTWMNRYEMKRDFLQANRFFITCDTFDDLPYVLSIAGEDNFLIGSDYSHADMSAEIDALKVLQRQGAEGRISSTAVHKILDDNARAFYGL